MKEYGSYLQLRGSSMFVVILYQALNVWPINIIIMVFNISMGKCT